MSVPAKLTSSKSSASREAPTSLSSTTLGRHAPSGPTSLVPTPTSLKSVPVALSPTLPRPGVRLLPRVLTDDTCIYPDDEGKEEKKTSVSSPCVLVSSEQMSFPSDPVGHAVSRMLKVRPMKFAKGLGSVFPMRLGTTVDMSTNGTGFVNAVINVSLVSSNAEFSSFAAIFAEFFVVSMKASWMPISRYNGPVGYLPASNESSQPLAVLALHHGVTAPGSATNAMQNVEAKWHSTADPFTYTWKNTEKATSDVVPNPSTSSALPTQTWCLTASTPAAAYTGQILLISPVTFGCPATTYLGTFAVWFDVLFRNRE